VTVANDRIPPLVGINIQLALRRREASLQHMDDTNAKLRGSGFNLDPAGPPYWDRQTWESYRAQFGSYPYGPDNRPPDVATAPPWVKKLCGFRLTPAEQMGENQ
jgi:hypothetical protein